MTQTTTTQVFTGTDTPDVEALTSGVFGVDEQGHLTGDPAVLEWARGVAERGRL